MRIQTLAAALLLAALPAAAQELYQIVGTDRLMLQSRALEVKAVTGVQVNGKKEAIELTTLPLAPAFSSLHQPLKTAAELKPKPRAKPERKPGAAEQLKNAARGRKTLS